MKAPSFTKALLETILAPIWTWLAIGETPSQRTLIGGLVVVIMLIIFTAAESQKTHPRKTKE